MKKKPSKSKKSSSSPTPKAKKTPKEQSTPEPKSVSLFPALEDPEKCKQINEAIERRNYADYQCYMTQRRMFSEIGSGSLFMNLLARKQVVRLDADDLENAASIFAEMAFWGKVRENANEIFAHLLANREVTKEMRAEFDELKTENLIIESTKFLFRPFKTAVVV